MKLLISIIVILTIIIFCLIIFNSNIYFSEDFANFESSYDQNTIDDLIPIAYLPNNLNDKIKITEYDLIDLYKKILNRSPTTDEITLQIYKNKDELIEELYNSFEYDKIVKLQTNLADSNIESSIAKRNLTSKIMDIYKRTYNKNVPEKMIVPLRDCYIHLRSNYYLFLVFIENKNYPKFENDVLTTISLTKKVLLLLFNKHYNLLELKLLAQDKIKKTVGKSNISIDKITAELSKLTTTKKSIPKEETSTVNLNELKTYLNNPERSPLVLKETYQNSNDVIKTRDLEKEKKDIIKKLPEDSEVYVRVYNPITYKQTYKGSSEYRPPICTSLGQKSLEVPIFPESKLLLQGAEIDKAFTETQVGSIMPKFIYKEYQDIRVK